MSLENKIEALTAAVVALTAKLESSNVAAPAPVAPAPAPVVQAAPVVVPVVAAPVAAAPVMPAPPSFVAPVAAPVDVVSMTTPFNDPKGLIGYVMDSYKTLGPQKGALIQGVLTGLGYQNINDVKPEHYAALHSGVEALK